MRTVLNASTNIAQMPTDTNEATELAAGLTGVLADSYVLMVKTQGVHWNVVGPLFLSLHQLTEQHYQDLFAAIDEIAERVRAIGHPAPTSIASLISIRVTADVFYLMISIRFLDFSRTFVSTRINNSIFL